MTFTDKLNLLADKQGWKGAELARRTGVTKTTAGYWLNGTRKPFSDPLLKIAREFGVTVDSLVDDQLELQESPSVDPLVAPDATLAAIQTIIAEIGPKAALRRLIGMPSEGGGS